MQSMNKSNLKNDVIMGIAEDKYDLPILVCKNIKSDVTSLFKKYIVINDDDVKVNLKVLKGNEFVIQIDCKTNGFIVR